MFYRNEHSKPFPLNIVGSSTFGRYPKISIEKTYNMFISDQWLIPYAGYKLGMDSSNFNDGTTGRALHSSSRFGKLFAVIGNGVFLVTLEYNQQTQEVFNTQSIQIGTLQTSTGVVYIAENNNSQVLFSDNHSLYLYNAAVIPATFTVLTTSEGVDFIPGYIDFHDTYFLAAVPASSTWRISNNNDGTVWTNGPSTPREGAIQTKPDKTQAVLRFPTRGNMIFVMGQNVSESWYDVGAQGFPYQRNASFNIDYGCINPATIALMDEIVVWLAINEKAGPIIMYSNGGAPEKITTDGIDYFFSNLQNPADSQGFIFRQDGHIFYHLNFYSDNVSLFYDFNSQKFFFATDERNNYFIASVVAFFNDQYYFLSRNNGNLYIFDSVFTTYDGAEIPRIRTCKNIRLPTQDYFVATDAGFTIESGNTDNQIQNRGPIYLITQDEKKYITEGGPIFFITEDENFLITENEMNLVSEQNSDEFAFLIAEQDDIAYVTPRVDLSISIDGGEHFSSYASYDLPALGYRKNKLIWWQLGAANDLVCQFRFWGLGRFVATDGLVNIRV